MKANNESNNSVVSKVLAILDKADVSGAIRITHPSELDTVVSKAKSVLDRYDGLEVTGLTLMYHPVGLDLHTYLILAMDITSEEDLLNSIDNSGHHYKGALYDEVGVPYIIIPEEIEGYHVSYDIPARIYEAFGISKEVGE